MPGNAYFQKNESKYFSYIKTIFVHLYRYNTRNDDTCTGGKWDFSYIYIYIYWLRVEGGWGNGDGWWWWWGSRVSQGMRTHGTRARYLSWIMQLADGELFPLDYHH